MYYDCIPGEHAYNEFLKFLWIKCSDGSEKRFAEYAIDELKKTVPIWKKEGTISGEYWVGSEKNKGDEKGEELVMK